LLLFMIDLLGCLKEEVLFYDAQCELAAAHRLRSVRCKGLLDGRPVWSRPCATSQAAQGQRPQVL